MSHSDMIVMGGGIASVLVGYELSQGNKVCLLEMESTLAFHTTGRSAAAFLETYGGPEIRALATGSRAFRANPLELSESELMTSRPAVQFAKWGRGSAIEQLHADVLPLVPGAELLSPEQVAELFLLVARGNVERGMYEPGAMEVDVAGLHRGYVRGLRANGGEIARNARVVALTGGPERWTVGTADGERCSGAAIVDAAGAWG